MEKAELFDWIEEEHDHITDICRDIWEHPQLGMHETYASSVLQGALSAEGFSVETGTGGLPTAFVASYGDGDPTIGILGEFDALPGLSQRATADRDPVEAGGPGHGCGHNLLGTAGVGAAIALARAIDTGDVEGTVRYYGCPAEETLVGKVYMARDGVFDDLDAAVTWHPNCHSMPFMARTLALDSIRFTFHGQSAHAAVNPEGGRSALDAVQLLNTAVEYIREHVTDDARIHYAIVDGGEAPNVVPAKATVWYFVRGPNRDVVEHVRSWVEDAAEGAATMTRTSVEREFLTGCYDTVANETVSEVIHENLELLGGIEYTEEERELAADLQQTLDEEVINARLGNLPADLTEEMKAHSMYTEPLDAYDAGTLRFGSTDVGDVSWITPLGQFWGATWPVGTPAHTWQATAANGSFGPRGAVYAAKVLAGATYDLLTDAERLAAARAEFEATTAGTPYESPLPEDAEPPFDLTT
ncbi:amidohydrolase [Haloarchaeobius sp. TZWSO28]|uniref:amidohydrolase n=1 Tax=Haloarchaeobius sp. TZWSO28 TaxID=3446119 RepID=UPI003EB8F8B3